MDLRVMTYNLRFADYDNGAPHSWSRRRPAMAALLRQESPDLIGTQEGLYRQLRDVHRIPLGRIQRRLQRPARPAAQGKGGVYEMLLTNGKLADTWTAAPPDGRGREYDTWHDYKGPSSPGRRIDWILTSPGVRTTPAGINTFALDGRYPSDHFPVQATLDLGEA